MSEPQLDLLAWEPSGETINRERDRPRLAPQMRRVHDFVIGLGWFTLAEIARGTKAPEASVSARLRDLRALGFTVDREPVPDCPGLHRYRVTRGMPLGAP